jgi:glutamine synthetase
MKPGDVEKLIKDHSVQAVDLRFVDLPGLWQHFTLSSKEFSTEIFDEGIGFDGSSIRGFQAIQESDMLLFPDPATAFIDPFMAIPTLVLICNVKDPVTSEAYSATSRRRPRAT